MKELDYMTESEARRTITEVWKAEHQAPTGPKFEAYLAGRIKALEEQGLLITDQQQADIRAERLLIPGDAARYVGPKRTEDDGYVRPTGQYGFISRHGDALRFEPEDDTAPALVVMPGTRSYYLIERVPGRKPPPIYAIERNVDTTRALRGKATR